MSRVTWTLECPIIALKHFLFMLALILFVAKVCRKTWNFTGLIPHLSKTRLKCRCMVRGSTNFPTRFAKKYCPASCAPRIKAQTSSGKGMVLMLFSLFGGPIKIFVFPSSPSLSLILCKVRSIFMSTPPSK